MEDKVKKKCERCGKEIPLDFVNPLCWDCYDLLTKPKVEEVVEPQIIKLENAKNGITEETYMEHPQAEDKEQWKTNITLFERRGVMLWKPTKDMYNFIKDYNLDRIIHHPQYPKFIWRPKIVDVGCGCGVGSNIMSQEADFVWGIDKNENSVKFAQECFTRVKNQIYYSSQITFDVVDILTDTREFMQFDQVVAIEIIEHIDDYKNFLKMLTRFEKRDKNGNSRNDDPTEYFISTPNRNNNRVGKHGPKNKFHVREWTSNEFYNVLSEFFKTINFYDTSGKPIPPAEYSTTEHTPILAKCKIN